MGGLWVTLKRRVRTLQPGARFHSYSVVKDLNAATITTPSYTGHLSNSVAASSYVIVNMTFIDIIKSVNDKGFLGSWRRSKKSERLDTAKLMEPFVEVRYSGSLNRS